MGPLEDVFAFKSYRNCMLPFLRKCAPTVVIYKCLSLREGCLLIITLYPSLCHCKQRQMTIDQKKKFTSYLDGKQIHGHWCQYLSIPVWESCKDQTKSIPNGIP